MQGVCSRLNGGFCLKYESATRCLSEQGSALRRPHKKGPFVRSEYKVELLDCPAFFRPCFVAGGCGDTLTQLQFSGKENLSKGH